MRLWIMLIAMGLLAACTAETPAETAVSSAPMDDGMDTPVVSEGMVDAVPTAAVTGVVFDLPDLGAAPEITNEVWVNADTPVTLASQRGKVVLIEFWTFG